MNSPFLVSYHANRHRPLCTGRVIGLKMVNNLRQQGCSPTLVAQVCQMHSGHHCAFWIQTGKLPLLECGDDFEVVINVSCTTFVFLDLWDAGTFLIIWFVHTGSLYES